MSSRSIHVQHVSEHPLSFVFVFNSRSLTGPASMSGHDQEKKEGEPGGRGRGHVYNTAFIHSTTRTHSLLLLRAGVWERGGTGGKLECYNSTLPSTPVWTQSASTQGESDDEKQFRKARTVRGEGRRMVQVGWRELLPPCWDPPSPSRLAGKGQPATPVSRSGAARGSRQGAGGVSERLALQGDEGTAPQLHCQDAAVLDLLLAAGL